jgi:hypothetical protein
MKIILVYLFFLISEDIFPQNYILSNETLLFSFETKNKKKMVLARDKKEMYIVYRFGNKERIELEYPEKNKSSWSKFRFSFYFRGGPSATDIDDLFFVNDNFEYRVYSNYFREDNEEDFGIEITDLKTKKITNIKGQKKTKKGNLSSLRESKLMKVENILDK